MSWGTRPLPSTSLVQPYPPPPASYSERPPRRLPQKTRGTVATPPCTGDAAHVTRSAAGAGYFVLRCLPEGESPDSRCVLERERESLVRWQTSSEQTQLSPRIQKMQLYLGAQLSEAMPQSSSRRSIARSSSASGKALPTRSLQHTLASHMLHSFDLLLRCCLQVPPSTKKGCGLQRSHCHSRSCWSTSGCVLHRSALPVQLHADPAGR